MNTERYRQSFISQIHDGLGLSVYSCGFERCLSGHSWGPAMRDHYLIHIISSGQGAYTTGGHTYTLKAGDGFLICPGQTIFYKADKKTPWEYYWVGFNGAPAARLLANARLDERELCFKVPDAERLTARIMDIYVAGGHTAIDDLRMTGQLYLFFAELLAGRIGAGHRNPARHEYVETAIKYMEHNFSNPITVEGIAAAAGVSRSHLYRLFMQEVHLSPNEYLTRLRIDKACLFLNQSGLNISEVAYSCGYTDPLYFSKVFHRLRGLSPSEYIAAATRNE